MEIIIEEILLKLAQYQFDLNLNTRQTLKLCNQLNIYPIKQSNN